MRENDINLLRIYDIDGTITTPGHDLWHLTTRSLSSNPCRFDKHIELWKDSLRKGDGPYESSKVMMQKGVKCIDEDCRTKDIKKTSKRIISEYYSEQRLLLSSYKSYQKIHRYWF